MYVKKQEFNNQLRVLIKSFLSAYLLKDIKFIFLNIGRNYCKRIININIFLPTKIKKFSVVRSPTTSKLSKEQFEFRFFKSCLGFTCKHYLDFLWLKQVILSIHVSRSYLNFQLINQTPLILND
jgi:ribosomal protein S10